MSTHKVLWIDMLHILVKVSSSNFVLDGKQTGGV